MRVFDYHETERMDATQPISFELEETLRELEMLNARFGGHGYVRRFLQRHLRSGRSYRVLDLATGGGDFPRVMVDWARPRGIQLTVDAIDANGATLELARRFAEDRYPEIRFLQGDVLTFPARHDYDFVHCSLSLHHFPSSEAVTILRRCLRLSRDLVLVTDLRRSLFTRLAVHVANSFFQHQPMTVHDGDTSARRAFSYREFRVLAKGAGWTEFGHERFAFCRQALWVSKQGRGLNSSL
jgi:ubiquinone/menaquinone biosynthesis C-methylase UbiE